MNNAINLIYTICEVLPLFSQEQEQDIKKLVAFVVDMARKWGKRTYAKMHSITDRETISIMDLIDTLEYNAPLLDLHSLPKIKWQTDLEKQLVGYTIFNGGFYSQADYSITIRIYGFLYKGYLKDPLFYQVIGSDLTSILVHEMTHNIDFINRMRKRGVHYSYQRSLVKKTLEHPNPQYARYVGQTDELMARAREFVHKLTNDNYFGIGRARQIIENDLLPLGKETLAYKRFLKYVFQYISQLQISQEEKRHYFELVNEIIYQIEHHGWLSSGLYKQIKDNIFYDTPIILNRTTNPHHT